MRALEDAFGGAGTGERSGVAGSGGRFRGAGTGGSGAPSGLDMGTRDEGGLDGTSGGDGERRGGSSISRSVSQSIRSPSMSSSPSCIISSPSAMMQGAELLSALSLSAAFFHVAGSVASSRTLTDVISGCGSAAILSTVAPCGDGSSVSGGLRHALRAAGRWWAGHWVGSGTGEILLGTGGERRSISRQCPLHKSGEIRSRAIHRRRRSARDVQASVKERTERVVRVGGEAGEDQKQSGVALERSLLLEVFRAKEGIHGNNGKKRHWVKRENKQRGKHGDYCIDRSFCHNLSRKGARNEETRKH